MNENGRLNLMNVQAYKKGIGGLLIAIALIGTGCFGGEEETAEKNKEAIPFFRIVESQEFTLQVPEDWETIQTFDSKYPKNTVVAFRNNIQDHSFVANLNIVKNTVAEGTSTKDYALQTYETISKQLLGFKEIGRKELSIQIGNTQVTTYLFEFEGTNDSSKKARRFLQAYGVKGTQAYIFTGTYDVEDTELAIDQLRQSMETFQIR